MIRSGLQNMQFTDFYRTYEDENGDEETDDVTCDRSSEPCATLFQDEQAADSYEALPTGSGISSLSTWAFVRSASPRGTRTASR